MTYWFTVCFVFSLLMANVSFTPFPLFILHLSVLFVQIYLHARTILIILYDVM